jgi:hypothetical protein
MRPLQYAFPVEGDGCPLEQTFNKKAFADGSITISVTAE